ncbi:MAG: hypothetical protein IKM33_01695 [Clostridia bacterium]|nr:hypothetical protein [Clostridia bacterium]
MSYVLFRVDGDVGRVVAARLPDDRFLRVGDYVQDRLAFCGDALSYVTRRHDDAPPLFIRTDAGVGILSGRYHLSAGLGLYLHIHTRPSAAARLIHGGALGCDGDFAVSRELREQIGRPTARDGQTYPALLEAWRAVAAAPREVFSADSDGGISLGGLRSGIAKLASFVGCEVAFTVRKEQGARPVSPYARVKCYRPLLLEGILLCLLSEMRERSATGTVVCRLEPPSENREGVSLTLRYPLRTRERPGTAEVYEGVHRCLAVIGESGGLDLYASTRLLPPRDPQGLPEAAVTLDWLLDPSVLSSSDIKARLSLARVDGHRSESGREADATLVEEQLFGADLG